MVHGYSVLDSSGKFPVSTLEQSAGGGGGGRPGGGGAEGHYPRRLVRESS